MQKKLGTFFLGVRWVMEEKAIHNRFYWGGGEGNVFSLIYLYYVLLEERSRTSS